MFRQLFVLFLQTCLKLALVQTTFRSFPPNLSEVAPGSDSFSAFSTKPVRSWLGFRQLFGFFHQTCLKLAQVQTAFRLFPPNLSEVGSGSDNFLCFSTKPVRSWLGFRQLFVFIHQTCLKLARIQTTFRLFPPNLSEVGSSSDNFLYFSSKPV